jgi:hypothetical protein
MTGVAHAVEHGRLARSMTSEVIDILKWGGHSLGTFAEGRHAMKHLWILPAVLAVAFGLFTIWTMVTTGQPLGFVADHTHSRWGAQIGIDLFNALGVGLYFGTVMSREYRFRAWPYVVLTLCTGSPGVLALAARVLYARSASVAADTSGSHPVIASPRGGVPG